MSCDNPLSCVVGAVTDPLGTAGSVASNVAGDVAGSAWDHFVTAMVNSANSAIKQIMALWMKVPDPAFGPGSTYDWLQGHIVYLVVAALMGSMFYAGIRLAIYSSKSDAVNIAEVLVRTALTSVLTGWLVSTGMLASNALSDWIMSLGNPNIAGILIDPEKMGGLANVSGLVVILAIFVIITQLIQMLFMIFRIAIVVVLAGLMPVLSATSFSQTGRQAFASARNWLLAFILLKPAAALVYAVSFKLQSDNSGSSPMLTQLSGIFLMLLAVLALPALLKLVAPVTGALGGANAASIAGATIGSGIALGAMAATGGAAGGFAGSAFSGAGRGMVDQAAQVTGGPSGNTERPTPPSTPPSSSGPSGSTSEAAAGGDGLAGNTGQAGTPGGAGAGSGSAPAPSSTGSQAAPAGGSSTSSPSGAPNTGATTSAAPVAPGSGAVPSSAGATSGGLGGGDIAQHVTGALGATHGAVNQVAGSDSTDTAQGQGA